MYECACVYLLTLCLWTLHIVQILGRYISIFMHVIVILSVFFCDCITIMLPVGQINVFSSILTTNVALPSGCLDTNTKMDEADNDHC